MVSNTNSQFALRDITNNHTTNAKRSPTDDYQMDKADHLSNIPHLTSPHPHKNNKHKERQHFFQLAMHFLQQKEYKQAETYFQKAAALGCSSALYRLGIIYMSEDLGDDRRDVVYSYKKAFECFAQAGNMGHSGAITNIGTLFFNAGKFEEAIQYYMQGANMGCIYAYKNIGKMYESGHGVSKDNTVALQYFKKCGSDRHIQRATRSVLNETCCGAI